jgi:hypothetical protein
MPSATLPGAGTASGIRRAVAGASIAVYVSRLRPAGCRCSAWLLGLTQHRGCAAGEPTEHPPPSAAGCRLSARPGTICGLPEPRTMSYLLNSGCCGQLARFAAKSLAFLHKVNPGPWPGRWRLSCHGGAGLAARPAIPGRNALKLRRFSPDGDAAGAAAADEAGRAPGHSHAACDAAGEIPKRNPAPFGPKSDAEVDEMTEAIKFPGRIVGLRIGCS